MLFFSWFPPTGVEASAAQNAPVTKTCLQCGAVLPSHVRACSFCEAPLPVVDSGGSCSVDSAQASEAAWRSELAHRVESYRSRRRRASTDTAQSRLPFSGESNSASRVSVEEDPAAQGVPSADSFSFTIAIGRSVGNPATDDSQLLIDVSSPPEAQAAVEAPPATTSAQPGLYPVAAIEERRFAAVIDIACLLFACGGFLGLFGSLGGQFAFSKLNAVVYSIAFAIVYVQYFLLFTVFGGTTPGMMLRGLHVVDFSGEPPSPRQLLRRAAGYLLSAGTFFLGFFWAMWDEDSLTWHDRLSHTYLSSAETLSEADIRSAATSR